MLVAGWKHCSLVDVYGSVSFTLWLCGCNLKCPFCHNWRVSESDSSVCRDVPVEKVIEEVSVSRMYVDYVHVTGGEPLLQHAELRRLLLSAKSLGVKTSLNSNLTIPSGLRTVIDVLDHVATDAKVPYVMYGVPWWREAYERFLESAKIIGEHGVPLELRVPLAKVSVNEYIRVINDVVSRVSRVYLVVNRVLCEPAVTPRNSDWCRSHYLSDREFAELAEALASYAKGLGVKTYILYEAI